MTIWAYTYDDRVVALVESGVSTVAAIRAELRIPGGTMKQVMTRLVRQGRIKMFTRGWYIPCATPEIEPAPPAMPA